MTLNPPYRSRVFGVIVRERTGVVKIEKSRKYKQQKKAWKQSSQFWPLLKKTMPAILSSINKDAISDNPEEMQNIDKIYINIRNEIKEILQQYGIKAVA